MPYCTNDIFVYYHQNFKISIYLYLILIYVQQFKKYQRNNVDNAKQQFTIDGIVFCSNKTSLRCPSTRSQTNKDVTL